jgi:hypothetical protein
MRNNDPGGRARSRKWRRGLLSGMVTFMMAGLVEPAIGAQPATDTNTVAREIAAKKAGRAVNDMEVISSATASYPLSGRSALDVKVLDGRSGDVYQVSLDDRGREADTHALRTDEAKARSARHGKLEPALAERLGQLPPGERVSVAIWLKEGEYTPLARPQGSLSEEEIERFLKSVDEHRAAAVSRVTAPFTARLRSLGETAEADTYAPVLFAELPAGRVRQVAEWDEVDTIYVGGRQGAPELDVARSTVNAHLVQSAGYTGSGVKLAQVESKGGRVATSNPNLAGVTQDTTYVCQTAGGHATAVAGIIRSTHSVDKGIAPGASLWAGGSCSGAQNELTNRSTAAADWGAKAINLSWGDHIGLTPGSLDRFYDNLVINRYRSVVKSAGNRGAGCGFEGDITSPAMGYNVLAVGNFNDMNSVGWTGDAMSGCSSWKDPISVHNDREKPDLAAPGSNIISTTLASPWVGDVGSGTSYAAPVVTGAIGQLVQKDSLLGSWPESIRAVLQASAVHNIEGATRLSEYDGAGGLDVKKAYDTVAGGKWGKANYTCTSATQMNAATMTLTGGQRTRVAIAWDNDPAYADYANRPGADLDLQVVNSAGTVVAGSYSFDNTHEIVDFTPSTSGSYTLRVNKASCLYSPRYLGWAWSN